MSSYSTETRATTTKTHTLDLGNGTTLDDLRRFAEGTAHLGAGTPVQTGFLGFSLAVHEVRVNDGEEKP